MESNLNARLIAVQAALEAPKGQYNKFGGYKYRSCEDILEAVKPLLAEQGLALTLTDEVLDIGGWHYVQATATVTDGKESVSCKAYARESETKKGMDASQITGTASSYARKYALNGLFIIDDTKDADTMPPETQQKPPSGHGKAGNGNDTSGGSKSQQKQNQAQQKTMQQRIAEGVQRLAGVSPMDAESIRIVISDLSEQDALNWLISEYKSAKAQLNGA